MFGLRRKIGTGAPARRRPARECQVGIESLDTRAVPAIIVPSPGSPLLESGTGMFGQTILNVAFDEHGHGSAALTTTNPFNGAVTTRATLLPSNLDASGKPQPVPGINLSPTPTPTPTPQTILVFGQTNTAQTLTATQSGNTTALSTPPGGIAVSITSAPGIPANTPAVLTLTATSTGPATVDNTGHVTQSFSGQFSIVGTAGQNYLSGTFHNTAFGNVGGTQFSLNITQPGSPGETLAFTSDVPGLPTGQPVAMTLSLANATPPLSVVGPPDNATIGSFTGNVSATFSATPEIPPTPVPLIYRLPTPVADGDVVVRDFQSGQISDLLRFQTVSDPVQGTVGYMLVYSDNTPETPLPGAPPEAPAPADVGIPTPAASVLTQSAIEFGVEGFSTIEYQAEQANYSGLSDFNAVPFGTA